MKAYHNRKNKTIYCVYTGSEIDESSSSKEHIIPQSLGGNNYFCVNSSRDLNNQYGSAIDGKIAGEYIVLCSRTRHKVKGHSGNIGRPKLYNARFLEQELNQHFTKIRVETHDDGTRLFDEVKRKYLPTELLSRSALKADIFIENTARFKFLIKTFLGLGWRLYGDRFINSCNLTPLRQTLNHEELILNPNPGSDKNSPFSFITIYPPFNGGGTDESNKYIDQISNLISHDGKTSFYFREDEKFLFFAISCVGEFIGELAVKKRVKLFDKDYKINDYLIYELTKSNYTKKISRLSED